MSGSQAGARLRAAAARVVDGVVTSGHSLDAALAEQEAPIPESDRPLLRLLCYGALRRHWRLQEDIDGMLDRPLMRRDRVVNALLAIGVYQLTETRIPDHAVVAETVEATRLLRRPRLAQLVNAVLRRYLRDRISEREPSDIQAKYDHPQWLLDAFARDWPNDWQAIARANNRQAPMWLRVNSRRGSAEDYLSALERLGIEAEMFAGAAGAIRLASPMPVHRLPGFADGLVSVQDAAAQLAAGALLGGTEERVLDACAAPGGKSGHLLELGGDRLRLTCVDSDPSRLQSVAGNLGRLGLSATLVAGDASNPGEWWDGKPFDAILVDAPCSASGVIRRHPDIKLLRRPGDIEALTRVQSAIVTALWPLLAPGGRMLYVTCSVIGSENDAVIDRFLSRRDDAREYTVLHDYNIHDLMRDRARGRQILPGTADMDGFYYAGLVKVS